MPNNQTSPQQNDPVLKTAILALADHRYIREGFMYQGETNPNHLCRDLHLDEDRAIDLLESLEKEGKLVRRQCKAAWSYELPVARRRELIDEHNLAALWIKNGGGCFYPLDPEYGEITKVMRATANRTPQAA